MSDEKKELEVSQKKEIAQEQGEPTRQDVTFVPEVDITEDEEGITLYADMPGLRKEDLDIDVREGVLTLTAPVEQPPENRKLIYQEYAIGGFQRRFNLGDGIDQENISGQLDNGVLTLRLPKAPEHKPRKIDIKTS
jgi:HSP20 family molecular chaperone IbpA